MKITDEMKSYLVNKYHEIRQQDRKLFFENHLRPQVVVEDVIDFIQVKHMQLAVIEKDGARIFMILGSNQFIDWFYNFWFRLAKTPYSETGTDKKIKAHTGFYKSYLLIRKEMHLMCSNAKNIIIMGQSLGGAITTFAALDINYNFPDKNIAAMTTGSPKCGNKYFVEPYNRRVPDTYRYVYGNDIVPGLPPAIFPSKHVSQEIHLGPARTCGLSICDHMYQSGAYIKDLTKHN